MKIFGAISLSVIIAILGVLFFGGIFDTIVISESTVGPYTLIYRENRGPYEKIKFAMSDVFRYMKTKHSYNVKRGFGLFYDDPSGVTKENLRSIAGCVVDSTFPVDPPYQTAVFGKTNAIVGEFPIRSLFSYVTGVMKFYPELKRYAFQKKVKLTGPVMEIYDMGKKRIFYIAPIGQDVKYPPAPK